MKRWRYLSLSALVILLHQLAQTWVYGLIEAHGGHIEVLPFFSLVEVWNHGVSFGMFNKLVYGQWLLSGMAIIITLILLRWVSRADDRLTIIALCLVIGGAIGNVIDRVRFGAVADYLDVHAFGYHWPAFNMTDAAICIGVGLLVLPSFRPKKDKAV
jgi:signal peptidase II